MSEDKYAPARGLMDIVGAKESNNDYNIAYRGTRNNFTDMTIDEVLDWQKKFVNAGSPSSAVGRFQIIRKTLKDLKKKMKLSGDELFSPEMQDAMFVQLLKRRKYDKWVDGEISDEEFGNNIAKEWASFPVLTDMKGSKRNVKVGESYYAADGLNKALISPADVHKALSAHRTPKPKTMTFADLAGDAAFAIDPVLLPHDTF